MLFAFAALAVVLALGSVFHAHGLFFKPETHVLALWALSGYGILACGMTVVIVAAGIDLSVGSLVALAGIVFALSTMNAEMSGWFAVPFAVIAVASSIWSTIVAFRMAVWLSHRDVKVHWFWFRALVPWYVHRYRRMTSESERGNPARSSRSS